MPVRIMEAVMIRRPLFVLSAERELQDILTGIARENTSLLQAKIQD